ncbi:unnamed protein product [Caenorhabditis angaria]|uniref:Uncharacterized protein n=1 Tax=Caenorhabditis angaria TaxID=860376 RepID=A0A9P1N0H0_9PELO|nr:unnamed protein product [Caenorhabditis angaria]
MHVFCRDERLFFIYHFLNDDYLYPHVAPFLSIGNFAENCEVEKPIFRFSPKIRHNIEKMNSCRRIMDRLDVLIENNELHRHTCLILQAGSQATMRLASKTELRSDWNTIVEIPFCLYITENGECPRILDFEDLEKHEEWLAILEQVLMPMDNVDGNLIPIIAPQQTSRIVKDALMKAKQNKKDNNMKNSISHNKGAVGSTSTNTTLSS